jgi:periplasmic copper chaperone A
VSRSLLASVLLLCWGCGKPAPPTLKAEVGNLRITGGFAYAPITQESGAAYFTIRNTGDQPDTLVSVLSPIAKSAMIHGTMQSEGAAGMAMIERLPIPPGEEVTLKPGGTHLMLEQLSLLPKPGERMPVTLVFSRAGKVTLELPVRAYNE